MTIYTLGILEHNTKILLLLRQNTKFFNNHYGLPGGKIETNEPPTKALIRELYEELGISITNTDLIFSHCLSFKNEENNDILALVFKITTWHGELLNKEPYKCAEINWFDMDQLPDNIIPRHRHIIEKVNHNVSYSESGW